MKIYIRTKEYYTGKSEKKELDVLPTQTIQICREHCGGTIATFFDINKGNTLELKDTFCSKLINDGDIIDTCEFPLEFTILSYIITKYTSSAKQSTHFEMTKLRSKLLSKTFVDHNNKEEKDELGRIKDIFADKVPSNYLYDVYSEYVKYDKSEIDPLDHFIKRVYSAAAVESSQSKSFKPTKTTTTTTTTTTTSQTHINNNNNIIDLESDNNNSINDEEDEIIVSDKENEQIKLDDDDDDDDIIPTTQPLSDEEFDKPEIKNTPVKIIQQLQQQLPPQLLNTQDPNELPFQTTLDDGRLFVCFDKKIREELQKIEDTNLMIMKMFPNQNIPPLPPIENIHQLTPQTTTSTTTTSTSNNNNNNENKSKSTIPQKQNRIPTPTTTPNKFYTISVSPSPPSNRTNSVIPISPQTTKSNTTTISVSPSQVESTHVNNKTQPQHSIFQNIDDDTEDEKTDTEDNEHGTGFNNYNNIDSDDDEGYNDKTMKDVKSNNLSNELKRASSVEYLGENDGSGNSNNYYYNNNNNNNNNNYNNKKLKRDNDTDITPTPTPTTLSPTTRNITNEITDLQTISNGEERPYIPTSFGTPIVFLEALLRLGAIEPKFVLMDVVTEKVQQLTTTEIRDKVKDAKEKGDNYKASFGLIQQLILRGLSLFYPDGRCTLTEKGRLFATKIQPFFNEHREFKRINETNFNDLLGQDKVIVACDSNEHYIESFKRNFQEIGLSCIGKGIPVGDFLFIKNGNGGVSSIENNDDFQFYPFLFERKTWKDLHDSKKLKVKTQKHKLKACGRIKRLFYIIEGEQDTKTNTNIPMQDLKNLLDQNSLDESFSIIRTTSILDTTKQLAMIAKMLADGIIPVRPEHLISFGEFKQEVEQSTFNPTRNTINNNNNSTRRFQITKDQFKEYMISVEFRELVYQRLKYTLNEKKVLIFDSYADIRKELIYDHDKLFKAWQTAKNEGKDTSRLGYRCRTLLRCKYLEIENFDYFLLHLIFKFNLHVMTKISVSEREKLESFTMESIELNNVFELPLKPLFNETIATHVPDPFDSNYIPSLN